MSVLAWLLALWACGGGEDTPQPGAPELSDRVRFAAPGRPADVPVTTLPAEIVPSPGAIHDLGPAVGGRLVRWLVSPGDAVQAGTALAQLQSPELSGLSARASELASAVQQQSRLREISAAAVEQGVASAADLREAEASLAEARAAWVAVRRQLDAHRDTTTQEGPGWIWRAPIDGVVGQIRCPLGSVEPQRICLSLVRPEGVVLEVRVPERHLARLALPVSAHFTAADGRSWTFTELSRAPDVDRRTRSRAFRFAPDGDEGLLQGVSGRALLSVPAAPDVHEIPAEALTRVGVTPSVFVRDGVGGIPRQVQILGRDGGRVMVRGLDDTDEVAVRGVFLLKSLALLGEGT